MQGIFKIGLRLRDLHVFMWQSLRILNVFNTLTLKQIFSKTKTFLEKLEYRFLVKSTKIENASFPCKTAVSDANIKTNRMVSTTWTYHKQRTFASNYFVFCKLCLSLRTTYKELIWCTSKTNAHIRSTLVSAGVLFDGAFSLRVSLMKNYHK